MVLLTRGPCQLPEFRRIYIARVGQFRDLTSTPVLDRLQDRAREIDPPPGTAGHLLEQALSLEERDGLPGGRIGDVQDLNGPGDGEVGVHEQLVEEPQGVGPLVQMLAVGLAQIHQPARLTDRRPRHLLHAGKEEAEPAGPVPLRPHPLETVVILLPVGLDVVGEVEQRLGEAAGS
jgi:hypothetical protein